MRFLTCEPNFNTNTPHDIYTDEADQFYSDPNKWFLSNRGAIESSVTHLVLFDKLFEHIKVELDSQMPVRKFVDGFGKCERFLYSFFEQSKRVGRYIMLCKVPQSIDYDELDNDNGISYEF
jgi:hypothetical protein